jgi:hypothetical protein
MKNARKWLSLLNKFSSQFYFLSSKQTLINNVKHYKLFLFFNHIKIPFLIKKNEKGEELF